MTNAVLHTNLGDINVTLFDNHAPKTVANFIGLSDGSPEWVDPRTGNPGEGALYSRRGLPPRHQRIHDPGR